MQVSSNETPSSNQLPPAIAIMGPTASGKSRIAMEVAKHYPVEIISVDSAQVYRHMDIGTAKPEAALLASVPHHLIDLIDPTERYSAAQFRNDALDTMHQITERGKIPLLIGGTMLYYRALFDGLSALPAADEAVRMTIDEEAKSLGWPAMHMKLNTLDPITAARLQPTDSQRIQRALEVCYLANKPMSTLLDQPNDADFPFQTINIALIPSNRKTLHQRIAKRFDAMLNAGLITEVQSICEQFSVNIDTSAMRCVGYRQVLMFLNNEIKQPEMREMGIAATRQLAKRQLTWLRGIKNNEVNQFDCLADDLVMQVLSFLSSHHQLNI